MNRQSNGFSPPEFLIIVAAASLLLCSAAVRLLPQSGATTDLPPVDSVHVMLQLARVEAASRDVPCRFSFDPASRRLRVLDTQDTADLGDDRVLYETVLNTEIAMSRKERWKPLPAELAQHPFEVIFQPTGKVSAGAGVIVIASIWGNETLSIFENGELAVIAEANTAG